MKKFIEDMKLLAQMNLKGRLRRENPGKWYAGGSSNTVIISGGEIFSVPARSVLAEPIISTRIPPSGMITVLLLPPFYHFPGFSRRKSTESRVGIIVLQDFINLSVRKTKYSVDKVRKMTRNRI